MSYQLRNSLRLYARDYFFKAKSFQRKLIHPKPKKIILCNSYPKSGTHLLYQILYSLSDFKKWDDIVAVQSLCGVINTSNHIKWKIGAAPDYSIIRSHLMYCDEIIEILQEHNCKNFFIYRDLRDVAVSHARWITKEPRFFLHDIYRQQSGFDEQLLSSIQGVPLGTPFGSNLSQPNIGQDFRRWKSWVTHSGTTAIKFEDLVGERGGRSEDTRLSVIEKITDILEINLSRSQIKTKFYSMDMDPRESHTFIKGGKGLTGSWHSLFKEEHKVAFKTIAGDLLIDLGYESSLDW